MTAPKIALCLVGGGATGAMYQIGALAALEHSVEGLDPNDFDLYVGTSSGASVAAGLAGGLPVQRLYRAFLDPADTYFPLERKHVLRMDFTEWYRTAISIWRAFRQGSKSVAEKPPTSRAELWVELDRIYDTLPAGVFSLDGFERFLEDFFVRRSVPNSFQAMPRDLRVLAHDLDSGERALFGGPRLDHVPVTRACIASMAISPFFSPVRIGERHYLDAGAGQIRIVDVAHELGADVIVIVNPMVPVNADLVPTGHGPRPSARDKGMLWVANQAVRIGIHALLQEKVARVSADGQAEVILIEPEPSDAILFMHNPASFAARRNILEYAYRTTRQRLARWLEKSPGAVRRAGWKARREGVGPAAEDP